MNKASFNKMLSEVHGLDIDQLLELNRSVVRAVKTERRDAAARVKSTLNVGDKVSWDSKRGVQEGVVTDIKRKYAHVEIAAGNLYRVPMQILEVQS